MTMPKSYALFFYLKTVVFFTVFTALFNPAQAQIPDTVYTKPELNQGLPPAREQPVIVTPPPARSPMNVDSLNKAARDARQKAADERPSFRKRFFTGGGFALSFGDYTFVQFTPILAYRLTDRVSVGTGVSYIYVNGPFNDSFHIWGGKFFGQVMVIKSFFGHVEYEVLDFTNSFPVILLGAGYRQMFSDKFGMDTMLLLDLNNNERSYYRNPILRATFIVNL